MSKHVKPIRVLVEAVLLSVVDGALCVALRRRHRKPFSGRWALPRGPIRAERDVDSEAAIGRVLRKKAGLHGEFYLEQLATEGNGQRDPSGWTLSIVYCGLIPSSAQVKLDPASRFVWVPMQDAVGLAFDHTRLLQLALDRVRAKAAYSSLPLALMPEQFTLRQLQTVYEQLLGGTLDKRGFRRRIEELAVLEVVEGQFTGGVQRPAQIYRVRPSSRQELVFAQRTQRARQRPAAPSV